jgi:hypothetical protein
MNVSLTPEEKLGRMLYTFNCSAYEVAEYDLDNVFKNVFKSPLTY